MARYREAWMDVDDEQGEDPYVSLRSILAPEYAELSSEGIEELVETLYPGTDAEDMENFLKTLGRVGRTVADVGQRALPGVISGATTGAALGPWGALAGGLAGGALSVATSSGGASRGGRRPSRGGRRARRRPPQRRSGGFRLPSRSAIGGVMASPAAGQLLRTINRPEVTQALSSLAMGSAGRGNVNVGGVSVPTAAITTALRGLLEQVETEVHEFHAGESAGAPLYLLGADGEFAVDPTDEQARGERVLELLARAEMLEADDDREAAEDLDDAYDDDVYAESGDDDAWPNDDDDAEDEARSLYRGVYETTVYED